MFSAWGSFFSREIAHSQTPKTSLVTREYRSRVQRPGSRDLLMHPHLSAFLLLSRSFHSTCSMWGSLILATGKSNVFYDVGSCSWRNASATKAAHMLVNINAQSCIRIPLLNICANGGNGFSGQMTLVLTKSAIATIIMHCKWVRYILIWKKKWSSRAWLQ